MMSFGKINCVMAWAERKAFNDIGVRFYALLPNELNLVWFSHGLMKVLVVNGCSYGIALDRCPFWAFVSRLFRGKKPQVETIQFPHHCGVHNLRILHWVGYGLVGKEYGDRWRGRGSPGNDTWRGRRDRLYPKEQDAGKAKCLTGSNLLKNSFYSGQVFTLRDFPRHDIERRPVDRLNDGGRKFGPKTVYPRNEDRDLKL
jgi:hypothetical protein